MNKFNKVMNMGGWGGGAFVKYLTNCVVVLTESWDRIWKGNYANGLTYIKVVQYIIIL